MAHARCAVLAGYTPHVFSVGRRSATHETDFGYLHRVGSPIPRPRSIYAWLQHPWLVPAILELLGADPGPHVIHGFGAWSYLALAAARRSRRQGIAAVPLATVFVTHEHETAIKLQSAVVRSSRRLRALYRLEAASIRAISNPVERRTYRSLPTIVVNYESVRADLEQRYGPLPIRRLTYTPPTAFTPGTGADPESDPAPGTKDAPLIVSVSRHDGRKGLDVLIAALDGLRRADIPYRACLIGPGLLLSHHRRLVERLELQDRVFLLGRVPDVMDYLGHADVFVLPSREEGSGSVSVLEAMEAGTAIVASGVDGIPEDLSHERDALLVDPGDPVALQSAIARLLSDPGLRERLGANARRTYEERFTPDAMARQLADLYTELGLPPAQNRPGMSARPLAARPAAAQATS